MSTVKEIESAISGLSLTEMQAVRDWLEDLIEDQLEVSDEFKVKSNGPARRSPLGIIPVRANQIAAIEGCAANLLPRLRRGLLQAISHVASQFVSNVFRPFRA